MPWMRLLFLAHGHSYGASMACAVHSHVMGLAGLSHAIHSLAVRNPAQERIRHRLEAFEPEARGYERGCTFEVLRSATMSSSTLNSSLWSTGPRVQCSHRKPARYGDIVQLLGNHGNF
jgi:hypothetical protein